MSRESPQHSSAIEIIILYLIAIVKRKIVT